MRNLFLCMLFLSLSTTVFSFPLLTSLNYVLQAPPKDESPLALYSYLNMLYQRWNVLQLSTQEPNGNIDSDYGQQIIYNDGTDFWLAIETTSPHGTTWKGIKLGSV